MYWLRLSELRNGTLVLVRTEGRFPVDHVCEANLRDFWKVLSRSRSGASKESELLFRSVAEHLLSEAIALRSHESYV